MRLNRPRLYKLTAENPATGYRFLRVCEPNDVTLLYEKKLELEKDGAVNVRVQVVCLDDLEPSTLPMQGGHP